MFDQNSPPNNESPQLTILLAEDDSSVRRFIEVILQRADYKVISVEDGLTAMRTLLENKIDLIVADAMMPNLSGYDLCRIVRQNPHHQNTPFIILSGFENNSEQNQADAYLMKDDNLKENLLETLLNLLTDKEFATN
jgi:CheY-like chemotaxis protein